MGLFFEALACASQRHVRPRGTLSTFRAGSHPSQLPSHRHKAVLCRPLFSRIYALPNLQVLRFDDDPTVGVWVPPRSACPVTPSLPLGVGISFSSSLLHSREEGIEVPGMSEA